MSAHLEITGRISTEEMIALKKGGAEVQMVMLDPPGATLPVLCVVTEDRQVRELYLSPVLGTVDGQGISPSKMSCD